MSGLRLTRLRPPSEEIVYLDALRLASAVGIVGVHSYLFFVPRELRTGLAEHTIGVDLLVDLFFVISGFVIANFYADQVRSIGATRAFFRRRIARIFPLHWFALAANFAFWMLVSLAGLPANNAPSLDLVCILHTAALLDGVHQCGGIPLNYVSWTLSIEFVMYMIFPLLALAGRKSRRAFIVAASGLIAAILARSSAMTVRDWLALPPIERAFPAFALGMALFYGRSTLRRIPAGRWLLAACCISLAASTLLDAPAIADIALVYATVAAAVAADNGRGTHKLIRAMSGASQMTYSVYMWHLLFVTLFFAALGERVFGGSLWAVLPLAAACYAALIAWSYASFVWLETPARRWVDRTLSNLPPARVRKHKADSLPGRHRAVDRAA